ncbi:MAG: DUF1592 domain-containing protein, partial [Kiritimatiellae bacterium]|nr:DUF1592 domain-containing protein [Kiritimatiellia bacterium]
MTAPGHIACILTLCFCAHAAEPEARLPDKHLALFESHCFDCHDEDTQKGKVNLEDLSFKVTTMEQAELWQKVLNAVNAGEMPPDDKPQPDDVEKTEFLDDLAHTMVTACKILSASGGTITMRRLNRREYRNTMQHLLGVNVDVSSLPDDTGSGSFDTVGTSLFLSSDQFEHYLKLGRNAIDEVFERQAARKRCVTVLRVEPEQTINPANEKQAKKLEERYAQFTRWQVGVDKARETPENKARRVELEKDNPQMADPIHFYKFAHLLEGVPDPRDFGFRDAFQAALHNPDWDRSNLAYHQHVLTLPHRDQGTYLKVAAGTCRIDISPKTLLPGTYTLRVRAGVVEGTPSFRHFIEIGHPQRRNQLKRGLEGIPISSHQITGSLKEPQILEVSLEVSAKTKREFSIQERQPTDQDRLLRDHFNAAKRKNGYGIEPAIWIDWVELQGPIDDSGVPDTWTQRRDVEKHANRKVGGTFNGYFTDGYASGKAFLETGKPNDVIPDEQAAKFRIKEYEKHKPSYQRYLNNPLTKTGSLLTIAKVNTEETIALPPEHPTGGLKTKHVVESLPPGDYRLRFRIGAVARTEKERHFVELGSRVGDTETDFDLMQTFQVSGTTDTPQIIEVPVSLSAGGPRKFVLREKRNLALDLGRYRAALKATGVGPDPALWIDWVEWEGPISVARTPAALDQILSRHSATTTNSGAGRARAILTDFAQAAMRGAQPDATFIDRILDVFETRRYAGDVFEMAIRTPLSVILASPGFLYLNEPGDENAPRTLSDRELAVRLAYFLWSAPPDAQLMALAKRNELHQPDVLHQQVDRMIADSRAYAFVSGFVHQWLGMDRLDFFQFDVKRHREFDESARAAVREEVYRSFAFLLRDPAKGRLGKLLNSDYVIINGLLANYYEIDGVTGDAFRKVSLPDDSPRGGLLGMAAIHAMGSNGVESSPVERGAWVLRHLLHDPPPPAPPNVPQ